MAKRLVRAKRRSATRRSRTASPADAELPEPAPPRARGDLPRVQRGLHRDRRRRRSSAPTCAPRRSASRASSPSSCPTSPRRSACSRCCCSPSRGAPRAPRPTARWCCSPTRTARSGTATLIAEGQALVRRCLRRNQPGPYQIQAAINAVHSDARDRGRDRLAPGARSSTTSCSRSRPTPVVALNRAVALAEIDGPGRGARVVDALDLDALPPVPRHPWRAARPVGTIRRGGGRVRARPRATNNAAERAHLDACRAEVMRGS